jgi:hypothetical protein
MHTRYLAMVSPVHGEELEGQQANHAEGRLDLGAGGVPESQRRACTSAPKETMLTRQVTAVDAPVKAAPSAA